MLPCAPGAAPKLSGMFRHQNFLKFRISATTGGLWGCIFQHHPGSDPGIKRFRQFSRGGVVGEVPGVLRMAAVEGVDDLWFRSLDVPEPWCSGAFGDIVPYLGNFLSCRKRSEQLELRPRSSGGTSAKTSAQRPCAHWASLSSQRRTPRIADVSYLKILYLNN